MTAPPQTPVSSTPVADSERALYERWEAAGVFRAHAGRVASQAAGGAASGAAGGRRAFTVVMPPPNVTAVLHMGHGLNNTVQDVIVRWRRMCGDETLWLPGTDHAGIATQNVVEKQLAAEGKTRFDVGRDAFVARTTAFVEQTGGTILRQLRALGSSCDWTRTAYTFSPALSRGVREAFVRLHERGLIYRGHRVIHWCPRCLTSLSDEEAEHEEEAGSLYHISYPLIGGRATDGPRALTVATTRPETMLGDVAIAVHPDDDRYRSLIGARVRLPIANIEIPVIADAYADPAFGTGVVKITPAHDANDFDVGRRHSLPMPVVITPDGRMDEVADAAGRVPVALRGVDRFAARDRIVALLREQGRLERVESHRHSVRHCYRCDTVVEPRLSEQWFVRMEPLARPALAGIRSGEIRVLPERWEAVYVNWLEGIRDWNISRQLWWGHRVPVWYCGTCPDPIVARDEPRACPGCGGPVRQDDDVLDTWFSSWLWPFSTLGWPDETSPDLAAFYPTDVLVTAPEILFFWVARMVMGGYEFLGRTPFHTVYLHGTVRDTQHLKMSKSLGNGIDPLDVVALYGADALRYTVVAGMGLGADLILDPNDLEQSFAAGRNFVTKLRNLGQFVLANAGEGQVQRLDEIPATSLARSDRWILDRLDAAIRECDAALGPSRPQNSHWAPSEMNAGMRLNEFAECARRFVWNEFADWYVESAKSRLSDGSADREVARAVLVYVFDAALRLLHPIMPFITDELWRQLPSARAVEFVTLADWPRPQSREPRERGFDVVREAIGAVRQLRAEYAVPQGARIDVIVVPSVRAAAEARALFSDEAMLLGRLTKSTVRVDSAAPAGVAGHVVLSDGTEVIVPLAGVIDVDRECARLRTELDQLGRQLASLSARLRDERFVSKAPAHIVDAERAKERDWLARHDQLSAKVRSLCGA
jgi:valyl-tRNA synthetase